MLRFSQRECFKQKIRTDIDLPELSTGGKTALIGICGTAAVLLAASAWDIQLGLPTLITGVTTSAIVLARARKNPVNVIKGISWAVLPLVAGLFIVVEGLNKTGMTHQLSALLNAAIAQSETAAVWLSGSLIAVACNLMNNLPVGLIAGSVLQSTHTPDMVKSAVLIGVDLGPNLSITGSLATILWLVALRREGQQVSAWAFLKLGSVIMTAALIVALLSLWI
ncbi:ArsB/NhaD family transporter [Pedobacter sp.]|uniref:ArsB/NhaD family transporter n=1 Tax=Pedobacter sp. TaxID=1411316 RepID=UPI0031D21EA6